MARVALERTEEIVEFEGERYVAVNDSAPVLGCVVCAFRGRDCGYPALACFRGNFGIHWKEL